jgi:hypothetical protein
MCRATRAGKEWDINFDVINLAQIPSYLLISVPKLADCYSLGSEIVDPGQEIKVEQCMRNLDNNLSIKNLKIIVNSARGALDKSADDTGFVDAERLWEMTKENANSEYFKHGGFRAWRDYGCCVLLSSSQFAPGMQACDGVSYPVQIQVQMTRAEQSRRCPRTRNPGKAWNREVPPAQSRLHPRSGPGHRPLQQADIEYHRDQREHKLHVVSA